MKKILNVLLFTLFFSSSTKAQGTERSWEIRTAPLAFLAQWLTLEGMYGYREQWAFGPSVVFKNASPSGNIFTVNHHGYSLGFAVTHYFVSPTVNTWYMTARYHWENYTNYFHGSGTTPLMER